jgi:gamma-glutamylcyclotransferase (GGCT)/AIG2-like uncharacterized protein YtfP
VNKHLVFVYGMLRQGGVREMPDIFPGAKFIGQANVSGSLYDLGAHPGLMVGESNSLVVGEVYEIDDEILRKLDEIEAASDYWRKQVEVSLDNQRMICWVYEPDSKFDPHHILITSGDWIEYAKMRTALRE